MGTLDFRRYDDFGGSILQNFIDTTFPACPMCGTDEPRWTLKDKLGVVNRTLFKCERCECILSATAGDILGVDRLAITSGGLLKAIRKKQRSVIYLKVEAAGYAQGTGTYEGKELPVEDLQQLTRTPKQVNTP